MDSCEVSMTSLDTSRIAVKFFYEESGDQQDCSKVFMKSLYTSSIV